MKVTLLAPSKSIHTHKWALYYQKNGIKVKVLTFKDHYSEEHARDVETVVLPGYLPGKLSYFSSVFAVKSHLSAFQPDIFHAHYVSSYGFIGALASYQPFYVSVWGRDIYQFPQMNLVNKKIVEYTLRKADVICSTSHVMAKETSKYTDKPIEVTPFGVDLSKFYSTSINKGNDIITIGTVKALSDKYGIADLIRSFSLIHTKYPMTELLIVGEGPQKNEYMALTKSLGIESVTTFTGRVPNNEVSSYINKMDIFAVPSTEDSESFGVAAVEAMACGVPVVVSNVGGLPEVVKDGKTGFIVPKNNPEKLADSFITLIENPNLRSTMGLAGIDHVKEQYNWLDNAKGMVDLYTNTVKGSNSHD